MSMKVRFKKTERENTQMNYEKEFEFKDKKYRSSTLTNGLGRSGQRALLYATGMDEEDMKKPFEIGRAHV